MECTDIILSKGCHCHYCGYADRHREAQGNSEAETLYFDFARHPTGQVGCVSEQYLREQGVYDGKRGGRNEDWLRISCLDGTEVDLECGNGFLNIYVDYLNCAATSRGFWAISLPSTY